MLQKRIIFFLICLLILPAAIMAQTKEENAVAAAVETLRKGMISGDRKVLENIAANELSYGHSSGKIEDKAAFVEAIASKKSDFVKIDLSDQTIKIAGTNAIVRHILSAETNDGGVAGKVKLAVLLVWQKQNNQWKLLARQAVKV